MSNIPETNQNDDESEQKDTDKPSYIYRREGFRRGVYLLPNMITTASLFGGFYSLIATMHGDYTRAAWAILASAVFDAFDGTVARLTRTNSDFGVEYDSLSDAVAFGVAPAILMYRWALEPFGKWGWGAAFVFAACAVLRLARFNVQTSPEGSRFFAGIPSPAAGGMIATTVLFYHFLGWGAEAPDTNRQVVLLIESFVLGLLMVSTVPFISGKHMGLGDRVPFLVLVPIPILLAILIIQPVVTLFVIFSLYCVMGPVLYILRRGRRKEMIEESE